MAKRGEIKADPKERLGIFRRQNGNGGAKKKGGGRWLLHFFVLLMLFLASGAGVVWYMMDGDFSAPNTGDVPLILADKTPFKVRPEDPGGMNVPGRDRLVYNRLEENGAAPVTESLLPPPEEPLPPPSGTEKVIAEFKAGADVPAPEPTQTPKSVSEPVPETKAEPPAPPPSAPQPESVPTPAPAPAPVATPAPTSPPVVDGGYLVQIASLRSEGAVEREWARLKKAHADLLGALALFPQRIDLGPDKGVFYRLRAGALTEDDARSLCVELKARKVGCLPVRNGP